MSSDPPISRERTDLILETPRYRIGREHFATPDGAVERVVVHHPGSVAMLALTDPEHLLLVRQFRYPNQRWTLEIPAGTREPGEDPVVTADRELQEEAGFRAGRFTELLRFHPAMGFMDEEMIIYLAEDLTPSQAERDHGELIEAAPTPLADLAALRASGAITDAKTLLCLAMLGRLGIDL
jgi:ADP-ribose pyrophosphatase